MKKTFIIFLVNLILFNPGLSYTAESLSLAALVEEARKNNPEILAAKKRYESAKARIPQAKSLDDPQVALTFEKSPGSPFRLNKTMSEDRMLSISQMLPWFGKLPLKKKMALVESQMFAAELKNKELEIINDLKNSYYDLFMNAKETELRKESLEFLKNIATIAESKYAVGEIEQEEVFKINLEIARLANEIDNLREEKKSKVTRINAVLNRDPESPLDEPTVSEALSFDLDKDMASLYRLTLQNQPELLIFSYAIEKNKYAKSLAKKSFFPDLMAGIAMRGLASGGSIGPWDLMLAFTVPLWFWSKQRYAVKEAVSNLEEAEATYQAMKNKAVAETKDLATKVGIARNKIKLYRYNQIPLLESSIASSLASYRSGKGEIMILLDSERMLIEAKMSYYQALVEYNMNLADLERNVGLDLREVKR